jgi:hypothetical protein
VMADVEGGERADQFEHVISPAAMLEKTRT